MRLRSCRSTCSNVIGHDRPVQCRVTRLSFTVLLFAALLFAAPLPASQPSAHADLLERAKAAYFSGDLRLARERLDALPFSSPEVDYYRALILGRSPDALDTRKAVRYLKQAAGQRYAPAMWALGQAYDRGNGVAQDLLRAMDWYRKAEAASRRQVTPARYFQRREGGLVEASIARQIDRLTRQAETDMDARFQLGRLFDQGVQTQRDFAKALYWYRSAAENGHRYASFLLGYFFCRGLGVPADAATSNLWLARSGRTAICNPEEEPDEP